MPLAETLIVAVAPAIARTVLKLWAGDEKLASEGGSAAVDVLSKLIPDLRARNEADRQLAAIGEKAAESLQFIFEIEGKTLLVDDQEAVARLVAETLDRSKISAELLVQKDLDPVQLAGHFLSEVDQELAQLPQPQVKLYRRVIEEASQSIIDIAHQLPNFSERTFAELLRRNRVLIDAADRTLEAVERIRSQAQSNQEAESARFETEYRRAVARNLNRMELFGVDLARTSRAHPLSVAYVSLDVGRSIKASEEERDESAIQSVETALAQDRRILIRGPAGAGKTTLVRWIAVKAASRSFENPLADWNDALPFVIRLRQFSNSSFPAPEGFPALVASSIAGAVPPGWVHQRLKAGRAVVMVDGVDEVAEARRNEVRRWLEDLTGTFPEVRLIVTSRPHAVEDGWLEGEGFGEADLQPMDIASIEKFIDHWHQAVSEEVQQEGEIASLTTLANNLKATLRGNRAIRRLATSPLLCGVICALHRDTNEQLPEDRVDLYERCCAMLLERRDPESGLDLTSYPRLTYRQKRALLDDLAYWMIKNEWTELSVASARDRLAKKLENLRTDVRDSVPATPENVLGFFLERSGMLREPVEGKLDFAHRTFQEFMAAQAAVDEGDIGVLVKNATNPLWREVIVLGTGLARPREMRDLIMSLLTNGDTSEKDRYQLHLLAAACLDTAVDLDSEVKGQVETRVQKLVPPTSMTQAALLADAAGEIAVPFLKRKGRLPAQQAAACVRALGLIGSLEALQAIAEYAGDNRITVSREVVRAADRFDMASYVRLVAPRLNAALLSGESIGRALVRFGAQGVRDLSSVTEVSVRATEVNDLSILQGLTKLQQLDVENCRISDLSPLRGFTEIRRLNLAYTRVSDLSPLRGFTNLEWLSLTRTGISDLSPLQGLTKLESSILRIAESPTSLHSRASPNLYRSPSGAPKSATSRHSAASRTFNISTSTPTESAIYRHSAASATFEISTSAVSKLRISPRCRALRTFKASASQIMRSATFRHSTVSPTFNISTSTALKSAIFPLLRASQNSRRSSSKAPKSMTSLH
jgi:energy-coupling factor transporter ATP-binding protein EcfA2